jgi:hypothetical protein
VVFGRFNVTRSGMAVGILLVVYSLEICVPLDVVAIANRERGIVFSVLFLFYSSLAVAYTGLRECSA